MPILWVDVVAGSVYTTYLGFQTLDKKFGVAKKAKERMLDIYSKIYNNVNKFCEKSGIHKYLVRGALSLSLAASGAPLLSLAPMERVRRSQTKANSLILRC
ncbi:MAG: hypothetical protein QMD12_02255, partial [Candidatus Aenigmarchaeota archaeon]|nr:hypothetical protein [Candidatus Aenigmarchaeota archaeon]